MTDTLFLIAGGGTGAKVAEAFVHLCAAGLGPARAHLLFVDADNTNGNLVRAVATAESYRSLARWPWAAEATTGGRIPFLSKETTAVLKPFATALDYTLVADPIEATHAGGLRTMAGSDEMRRVLDLLYDPAEQEATCDDGFRARPNLGCLLLAEHLDRKLQAAEARPFLDALKRATAGGGVAPVVVAASVFGGTGASLLPVVRGSVEAALKGRGDERVGEALRWGAVMILPHYQPLQAKESVDPDRYLLDTAGALQFYGMAQRATAGDLYHAVYAVGSDNPARNLVRFFFGQKEQANPPYVEEAVAGLAALHFAAHLDARRDPVRTFGVDGTRADIAWADLPFGQGDELRRRFAFLLHLAAFHLRPGDAHRGELTQGLAALLRNTPDAGLHHYEWYRDVLDPWATDLQPAYANTPRDQRASALKRQLGEHGAEAARLAAAEYFGRLLLWADGALTGDDLRLLTLVPDLDYSGLYGAMNRFDAADVNRVEGVTIEAGADNALVRLLRTALTAMVAEVERTRRKGANPADPFHLVEPDGRVGLRISSQQVRDALAAERLGGVADEYTRTAAEPAVAA
jgi:hypothetical protein